VLPTITHVYFLPILRLLVGTRSPRAPTNRRKRPMADSERAGQKAASGGRMAESCAAHQFKFGQSQKDMSCFLALAVPRKATAGYSPKFV